MYQKKKKLFSLDQTSFDNDNVNCQCPNHPSIKPKRAPSRHRRLKLPALPETRFHSRIFNFVFAHGREGSDSHSSDDENARIWQMLAWILQKRLSKTLWKGKMTKTSRLGPLFLLNSMLSAMYWSLTVLAVLELHPEEVLN